MSLVQLKLLILQMLTPESVEHIAITANISANSDYASTPRSRNSVTSTANIFANSDNLIASTPNVHNSVTTTANVSANSNGNAVLSTANILADSDNLVVGTTNIPASSGNSVAGTANIFTNSGTNVVSNNSFITTSSPITIRNYSTSPNDLEDYLPKFQEMFSNMSKEQMQYIYGLCACFDCSVEALLVNQGPTLEALQSFAISQITVPLKEYPKISVASR